MASKEEGWVKLGVSPNLSPSWLVFKQAVQGE
jgi:hypothetical protein